MSRRMFLSFAILAFIQFTLGIFLSRPSLAQEWAIRGKPRGTLRVVSLVLPFVAARTNYAEMLVGLDKDNNNLIPALAEDWRWVNDRAIEFRLRDGVKFQNGERFNADAVRVNWEAHKSMENPRADPFLEIPDATIFEIIDDYKVRFTFPEPDGLALFKFRFWCWNLCPRGAFFEIVLSRICLGRAVPGSEFHLVHDAGHLWVLLHLGEVQDRLMRSGPQASGRPGTPSDRPAAWRPAGSVAPEESSS